VQLDSCHAPKPKITLRVFTVRVTRPRFAVSVNVVSLPARCVFDRSTEPVRYVTVAELAKECGVRLNDVLDTARELRIPASRGAAKLHEGHANRIRGALRTRPPRTSHLVARSAPPLRPMGMLPPVPIQVPRVLSGECECCGLRIIERATGFLPLDCCRRCAEHYPVQGEPTSRQIDRLSEHEARLRAARSAALEAVEIAKYQRSRAFESRDKYRRVLVDLLKPHEEHDSKPNCVKCGQPFPCPTWSALRSINVGIHNRVRELVALDEDDYGDEDEDDDYDPM
jgi:hypothetical protein